LVIVGQQQRVTGKLSSSTAPTLKSKRSRKSEGSVPDLSPKGGRRKNKKNTSSQNISTPEVKKPAVSASTSASPAVAGRKRQRQDSTVSTPQEKLTSKQKRSMERENKRKKVGSNFYEVTNVKNRNRDRKVPKAQRPAKPKAKY